MPDASIADLPAQIALALSLASSSTGADYHYLVNTARTESSFQTDAHAPTSSAQGLFQFIEETWIRTIKDEGPGLGLSKYAGWITKTQAGRYTVDTPAHRAILLALRNDPKISAMMAAAYARQNDEFVRNAIGRAPTSDELYIAHFLGPADAVRLINYREAAPSFSAPELFPAAAKSNRPIFYGDSGPRTVGQVYDLLVAREHGQGAIAPAADNAAYFTSGIDFGTWSPKVEKIYTAAARPTSAQLASASGPSILDFFAGQALMPKKAKDVGGDGWNASIDESKPALAPQLTVAADYPTDVNSWLNNDAAANQQVAELPIAAVANPNPVPLLVAEVPRIKVIHVPQD